ncbi:hypothetical protein [Haloferax sp. DFSO60]|uniref:hypothetical protein n=1 Tax=Haloferax sp. DFSO60 TaxID=3388652 RepID=UPI00397DA674
MRRNTLESVLSDYRRPLLSLALTVILLGSLAAAAVPSSAVETTLSGPDEVDRNDRMTVTATIDLEDGERVPIEAFQFTLSPTDADIDEPLTVTFAPNGTVLEVTPERGTINRGDIRIEQFTQSLTITPVENSASYGYGYRAGYDEQAGVTRQYGYGYGYGFGYGYGEQSELKYEISFDATSLDRESFNGQLSIDTGEETSFSSEVFQFEVVRPSNDDRRQDGDDWDDRGEWDGRDGDDADDRDDDDSDDRHEGDSNDRHDDWDDRNGDDDDADRGGNADRNGRSNDRSPGPPSFGFGWLTNASNWWVGLMEALFAR